MSMNNSIHTLQWLDPADASCPFPPLEHALTDPDGLLALGGDLSVTRLINAYRHGIFPWYSDGQPIMWWSPDPRTVLFPEALNISRSLAKTLRKKPYEISLNKSFSEVITACAAPRNDGEGTWITDEMQHAYCRLHTEGHAHSVESWRDGELVGGLYGIAIGQVFFGESMFAYANDASKVAFVHLVRHLSKAGFKLIDCQVDSAHLQSLGATQIPRSQFAQQLDEYCEQAETAQHFQPQFLSMDTN